MYDKLSLTKHESVFYLEKGVFWMAKKKDKKKKSSKKKEGFFKGIKLELKKVTWPSKKEVFKYSMATLVFCIVVMAFFQILDLGLSIVKGVFN